MKIHTPACEHQSQDKAKRREQRLVAFGAAECVSMLWVTVRCCTRVPSASSRVCFERARSDKKEPSKIRAVVL